MSPCFLSEKLNIGELAVQAERMVCPSTHEPDLDNANVGNARRGKCKR